MKLTSLKFDHKGSIPKKFNCDGEDVSPALIIEDIPEETKK